MKHCSPCQKEKPIGEFNKNRTTKDGYAYECRECSHAQYKAGRYSQTYYRKNRERIRQRAKKRWANPGLQRRVRARLRGTKPNYARVALRNAVQSGTITKPNFCERCLVVMNRRFIHGHHDDHDRPFDVRWLCAGCHGLLHANARAALAEAKR